MITVGVDEVGRGCWAGPVVAGAVILPPDFALDDGPIKSILVLRDSKKLSNKQSEDIAAIVHEKALAVGLGWVWPEEVDAIGLTAAVQSAMRQAVAAITNDYDEIIIDGNHNFLADDPRARAVIKADDTVPAASAASIVAKVARDNYMAEIDAKYPGYDFAAHVGYGTATHIAALRELGVCDQHRKSYKPIKKFLGISS
jgi:ribonuclease HII